MIELNKADTWYCVPCAIEAGAVWPNPRVNFFTTTCDVCHSTQQCAHVVAWMWSEVPTLLDQ